MIKELKPPKSKSDKEIINTILDALRWARENKVMTLSIAMDTKEDEYTDYAMARGASFRKLWKMAEKIKNEILTVWEMYETR